jgi:hypothetical protein
MNQTDENFPATEEIVERIKEACGGAGIDPEAPGLQPIQRWSATKRSGAILEPAGTVFMEKCGSPLKSR